MSYTILVWVIIMKLRIRDLREDHDLKQKQIAEVLQCDQSLYSKYEREERPLPLEYAERLADFYGVSLDYLVGRTDEMQGGICSAPAGAEKQGIKPKKKV